ncbi:MAG TPA: hypothetical protein VMC83_01535 [Streptosporangiaceae bacterium]|nr:hypothetical protein [Streptosporangiaceae bacterium]
MGLPFETPGGYPDDDTAPDAGSYTDDLTTPDYDGYSHDVHGDAGEDDLFEDDYDVEEDGYDGGMTAEGEAGGGWDSGAGPDQM